MYKKIIALLRSQSELTNLQALHFNLIGSAFLMNLSTNLLRPNLGHNYKV